MDFKTFAQNKGKADKSNLGNSSSKNDNLNCNKGDSSDDMKKFVEDAVNSRKNKSQDELLSEIIENTTKQKKEGTLKDSDLDNFYNSVAPMLNNDQLGKLKSIMKMLKW